MLSEIVRGLCSAGTGPCLRQSEAIVRRFEQWMALSSRLLVLKGKCSLRFNDPVVVVHLVVEPQRAARLSLRLFRQFDIRRTIGDRREIPDEVATEHAVHGDGPIALDR